MIRTLLLLATLSTACGSHLQTQAQIAHATALSLNRAEPVWTRAMREEALRAIETVCPHAPCDPVPMRAASDAVFANWQPVVVAWESVRVAHDAWRVQLEACRADAHANGCDTIDRPALRVLDLALRWRCAIRAPGLARADLDPLPGTPACTTDRGTHE